MDNVLECNNLTKKYGKKLALDGLNFIVPRGKIVGLLGFQNIQDSESARDSTGGGL